MRYVNCKYLTYFILLLFSLDASAQQRSEELIGLNGLIKRIERRQYKPDALDQPPVKTVVQYFENDQLVLDSVVYSMAKFTSSASYIYQNGWLQAAVWKKPDGSISDKREIKWLNDRTAMVSQFDENGACVFEMIWQYNADGLLTQYSSTDHCREDKRVDSKGNIYYDEGKQRLKRVICEGESTMITLYEVLERDSHGNPTRISEHTIRNGKPEDDIKTIATCHYTYAVEPKKTASKAFVEKTVPVKQKAKDPEACVKTKKYTLAQRKAFYPFSNSKSIALASYDAQSGERELPQLSKFEKIVTLNEKQVAALTDLIYNTGYAEPILVKTMAVDCPARKNAIVFLNETGESFEYILLHFGCDEYSHSSDRVKDGEYCTEKFSLLKKYFKEMGLEVGER